MLEQLLIGRLVGQIGRLVVEFWYLCGGTGLRAGVRRRLREHEVVGVHFIAEVLLQDARIHGNRTVQHTTDILTAEELLQSLVLSDHLQPRLHAAVSLSKMATQCILVVSSGTIHLAFISQVLD